MYNAMRLRFTRNWEQARNNQQLIKCQTLEKDLSAQLKAIRRKIDYETRVQLESHTFLMLKIDTMNETSLRWMDRFDVDYEAVEIDIQVGVEQLEGLRVKRQDLEKTFEKRQKIMDDFRERMAKEAEFQRNFPKFEKKAFILQVNSGRDSCLVCIAGECECVVCLCVLHLWFLVMFAVLVAVDDDTKRFGIQDRRQEGWQTGRKKEEINIVVEFHWVIKERRNNSMQWFSYLKT